MLKYMKKFTGIITIIVILLLDSCVSNNKFVYGPIITENELETIEIIDSIEIIFETTIKWSNHKALLERSYYELLKVTRGKYKEEIDIKNIVVEKRHSNKNMILLIPAFFGYSIGTSFTSVYARGDVIKYN